MLEILADFEVAATFFVTGQNVEANPELAACVVQEGHAIGNHSYSHPDLTTLNDRAASNQIGMTQRDLGRNGRLAYDHAPAIWVFRSEDRPND